MRHPVTQTLTNNQHTLTLSTSSFISKCSCKTINGVTVSHLGRNKMPPARIWEITKKIRNDIDCTVLPIVNSHCKACWCLYLLRLVKNYLVTHCCVNDSKCKIYQQPRSKRFNVMTKLRSQQNHFGTSSIAIDLFSDPGRILKTTSLPKPSAVHISEVWDLIKTLFLDPGLATFFKKLLLIYCNPQDIL